MMSQSKDIRFILNNENISEYLNPTLIVLDYLRKKRKLTGTKEGCREGDCGACSILIGESICGKINYKVFNSCLLPMGEIDKKHVVTIEGLNQNELNIIQKLFVQEGAAQCGFCTPGFVIALTGFLMTSSDFSDCKAIEAIAGNLCRCTGYMAIKRVAIKLCEIFQALTESDPAAHNDRISFLISSKVLPTYFLDIEKRLNQITSESQPAIDNQCENIFIAGGTDIFVQNPEKLKTSKPLFLLNKFELQGIWIKENTCFIGATTSVEEIKQNPVLQDLFPNIVTYFNLVASAPIRFRATLGGNITNASPIGDMTIFFIALNAKISLTDGKNHREMFLKDLFLDYKKLDKHDEEIIEWLCFPLPQGDYRFHFEKISKRKHLDIATVNSAIFLQIKDNIIQKIDISMGGVAPTPLYLSQTVEFLKNKKMSNRVFDQVIKIVQSEISPISDVRGSERYKRLLARQILFIHFYKLLPDSLSQEVLL